LHIALAFCEDHDVRKYPHATLRMHTPPWGVKIAALLILPQSNGSRARGIAGGIFHRVSNGSLGSTINLFQPPDKDRPAQK
jgi:hypothetical protein